jgi:NAD(P)-dependent dehydrogenase (short-subunit alcohol dehydrogenase family)
MTGITIPFTARSTATEVLAGVDLTGRRMIVTGGASGLGAVMVRALADAGARVTIATRNPDIAKPVVEQFPRVDAVALDLADLGSVRAFCDGWDGPVDVIVANAGIMAIPTRQITPHGWELQMATNYLGHFALVTGLRAALQAGERARVAVISSGVQLRVGFDFNDPEFTRRPYDRWAAYGQSKTAEVLLAVGIAQRWAEDGISANACAPGWIHTGLQRHVEVSAMQAQGMMDADGNLLTPDFFKTPEQGAATGTMVAASPLLDGVTGRYFDEDNQEAEVVDGGQEVMAGVAKWSVDPAAADRLWEYALPVITGA